MFSWVLIGSVTFIALWFKERSSVRTRLSNFNIYTDVSIKMTISSFFFFFLIYTLQTQSEGCQVSGWTSSGMWWGWFLSCFPSFLERKYFLILENCDFLWEICSPFIWEAFLLYKEICITKWMLFTKVLFLLERHFSRGSVGNLQSAVT